MSTMQGVGKNAGPHSTPSGVNCTVCAADGAMPPMETATANAARVRHVRGRIMKTSLSLPETRDAPPARDPARAVRSLRDTLRWDD